MPIETHIRRGHTITFGLVILFSIIELAISAWLTSKFASHHNYFSITERDRVHFLLFNSAWTIFFGIVYLALFLHNDAGVMTSVASHLGFLFITWILWTAGAAAITENLGGGLNCKTEDIFVYCSQLNALEGFAWAIWILITFMLVVVLARTLTASRRGSGYGGSLV